MRLDLRQCIKKRGEAGPLLYFGNTRKMHQNTTHQLLFSVIIMCHKWGQMKWGQRKAPKSVRRIAFDPRGGDSRREHRKDPKRFEWGQMCLLQLKYICIMLYMRNKKAQGNYLQEILMWVDKIWRKYIPVTQFPSLSNLKFPLGFSSWKKSLWLGCMDIFFLPKTISHIPSIEQAIFNNFSLSVALPGLTSKHRLSSYR